jgi:mRNA-degrading endonuclease toxin of MazEF toxin-antitoxin module
MPIRRGDIHLANPNPVRGREQAGQRPVLAKLPAHAARLEPQPPRDAKAACLPWS